MTEHEAYLARFPETAAALAAVRALGEHQRRVQPQLQKLCAVCRALILDGRSRADVERFYLRVVAQINAPFDQEWGAR